MSRYIMKCPEHGKDMLADDKSIHSFKYTDGSVKKMPIFYCSTCDCYYFFDTSTKNKREKIKAQYKGKDIFCTSNIFWETSSVTVVPSSNVKTTKVIKKTTKGATRPIKKGYEKKSNEKIIRIKELSEKEIGTKLKANIDNIRRSYPQIFPETLNFNLLVNKVFPSKITQNIVVRNMSFIGKNGYLIRYAELYNKNSSYLKKKLPENTYLNFSGRITSGEFVIEEMHIIENPVHKEGDFETEMQFMYDGPRQSNWLYDITETVAEHSQKITGEIADWNEYLEWKRQLAELKIKGLKYLAFDFNIDEREMTFLAVADGWEAFDDFKKYLRRNEVSIFSNNYSLNRWAFEFNREYQDWQNNDSGVALSFSRIEQKYDLGRVDIERWTETLEYAKKYKADNRNNTIQSLLDSIQDYYSEPIVVELVFDLSTSANSIIDRQIRKYGSVAEDILETISDEFYGDGYIATSQIGDFALLNRLKNGVNDLINGKSVSQGLEQWLFDIKKARVPDVFDTVEYWQNEKINEMQKRAVEKILSVPDVCLIQGPPGTGKTTVIAEAIYQLVSRNKRVLIASQANLAVDNALERLISNPKIRAIRLGSAKKIDSSVSNITEGNVLETFYDSIVNYIDDKYIKKWAKVDSALKLIEEDVNDFKNIIDNKKHIETQIEEQKKELDYIDAQWNSDEEYENKNIILLLKSQMAMLSAFCAGSINELILMLDKKSIITIWEHVAPSINELKEIGLYLTRVDIDIDDLDNPKRLSIANDALVNVLKNVKLTESLNEKLSSKKISGFDNKDLEELKLKESILKERLLTSGDPDILLEWKNINEQIKKLVSEGHGFSEAEYSLFKNNNFESMSDAEQKLYMKSTLALVLPKIRQLNSEIVHITDELFKEMQSAIDLVDEKAKKIEDRKERVDESIKQLNVLNAQNEVNSQIYLKKYNATPETLRDKAADEYRRIKQEGKTDIDRGEWEELFINLKKWVSEIPDYSSEKDIYLKDYINGCNVVGVSCTENTKTLIENGFDDFDVVIIDEVSKATPPELLIPMLRGKKVVLVGDHRQLPPLFNEHERTYQEVAEQQEYMEDVIVPLTMDDFEKYKDMVTSSLFQRYFENASENIKETLIYQYRMHTDIMDIINIFYDEHLKDGNEGMYTADTKAHYLSIQSTSGTDMIIPERHAYWFDSSTLSGEKIFEQRRPGSTSAENLVEAEMIMELLRKMELQYSNMGLRKEPVNIGIISFYYDQVVLIRQMLKRESFYSIDVEVNTVDRFQGKEKEIIFVSLVRNVEKFHHNIDSHIAAFQRINVAFSRAQNLLVIVGAKDMYIDQPVKLTDMNDGTEKVIMAYKHIIEMMDHRGTFFTSDEVISDVRAEEILLTLKKSKGDDE